MTPTEDFEIDGVSSDSVDEEIDDREDDQHDEEAEEKMPKHNEEREVVAYDLDEYQEEEDDDISDEEGIESDSYYDESDMYSDAGDLIFDQYRQAFEAHEIYVSTAQQLQHQVAEMVNRKRFTASSREEDEVPSTEVTDIEDRYKKYVLEHMKQRMELDELRLSNDLHLQETEQILQDKQNRRRAEEEAFRLLRAQATIQSESISTGKPLNSKSMEQRIEQERTKDSELRTLRIRYIRTKNTKEALEAQVREKEEPSKGLHVIDFEQLKMENSTFGEKIEEKNEGLLKSKLKATTIVHILSHVKEKLQFVQSEESDLMSQFINLKDDLSQHKEILSHLKRERDTLRDANNTMRDNKPLVASDQLLFDYENRRTEKIRHLARITELKEKYEISQDKIRVYQSIVESHNANLQQALLLQKSKYKRIPPILRRK